ncbi:T9SS type A sorting domain-containing protein [Fluviicola sp.]|uniref:T9SS type A sorting domain-containing protein n=1 Tax=Fluviicola sp. TaxID=1917219 RepID=UPI003D26A2E4
MVDLNGATRLSAIVSVNHGSESVQVIPNPNNGSFQVIGLNGMSKLELCDLQGKVLQVKETNEEMTSFETGQKSGVYVLRISSSKGIETIRVLVK